MKPTRLTQAAVASLAALGSLVAVALFIGGPAYVLELIGGLAPAFLIIAAVAAGIGAMPKPRAWPVGVIIGVVTGLLGAGGILLRALSSI